MADFDDLLHLAIANLRCREDQLAPLLFLGLENRFRLVLRSESGRDNETLIQHRNLVVVLLPLQFFSILFTKLVLNLHAPRFLMISDCLKSSLNT